MVLSDIVMDDVTLEDQLYTAAEQNRIDRVQELLQNEATNVNGGYQMGAVTPLHVACALGHAEVVRMILAHPKVDVNQKSSGGSTPFLFAAANGNVEAVVVLLEDIRIDLNQSNLPGATGIWHAASSGHSEVVKWILASGREVNLYGKCMGANVQEKATIEKRFEIAELLQRFVASPKEVRMEVRKELGIQETPLETIFGLPLPFPSRTIPEIIESVEEITHLFMADSSVSSLPEEFANCRNLYHVDLSGNPLTEAAGPTLSAIMRNNSSLRTLNLSGTKIGPRGVYSLIRSLVWILSRANFRIEVLELPDYPLESFDGLGMIPFDILQQGAKKAAQFMLDLFRSPDASPLYRTKLMVVGFENVGKTTLLDCLFPLREVLSSWSYFYWSKSLHQLQGRYFFRYKGATEEEMDSVVSLENRRWEVSEHKKLGVKLTPKSRDDRAMELYFPDEESKLAWYGRLRRVCMNEATHGIEIRTQTIDHPVTREYFRERAGRLELSVWDFAGQHEYYNSHHYFLSSRTVFLVLWRMSEGEDGLKGLEFWLKSLVAHLPTTQHSAGTYYSILVVGTYLDHPSVIREAREVREELVRELALDCGVHSPIQYFEVSCATLENVEELQAAVFTAALSHSYMGERVPKSYLSIEEHLRRAREEKKELPVLDTKELTLKFGDEELVKRALNLLSLWGECLYFDTPPELASIVILDPRFLAKGILADLFNHDPNIKAKRKDGIVRHSDLVLVWSRFKDLGYFSNLASTFIALLEKLGVCFVVGEDIGRVFWDQRSIIPALLPEKPEDEPGLRAMGDYSDFNVAWPRDPPFNRPFQIEQIIKFNIVPAELVSRLLVRMHVFIQKQLVWKNEVVILMPVENTQAWIRVEIPRNRFLVSIRGTDVRHCTHLLEWILAQVTAVASSYQALRWVEAVRSPHFSGCEIELETVLLDASRPPGERTLVCPETGLPIRAEVLLVTAGLMDALPRERVSSWWNFRALGHERRLLTLVVEDCEVRHRVLFEKLKVLLRHLDANINQVTKAYAIYNPQLLSAFEICRDAITKKHRDTGGLFRKEDWRLADGFSQRRRFLSRQYRNIGQHRQEWNDGTKTFVVPMVQGTSENGAFRIIKNGFGTVCSTDDGYYGRGMYSTSRIQYASNYAQWTDSGMVYLVSMVIPGNSFPVIEHPFKSPNSFLGRACRPGYQSHCTLVDSYTPKAPFPVLEEEADGERTADELVVFENSQMLPLFLVYSKEFVLPSERAFAPRKEWRFVEDELVVPVGVGEGGLSASDTFENLADQDLEDAAEAEEDNEGAREEDDERRRRDALGSQLWPLAPEPTPGVPPEVVEELRRENVEKGRLVEELSKRNEELVLLNDMLLRQLEELRRSLGSGNQQQP